MSSRPHDQHASPYIYEPITEGQIRLVELEAASDGPLICTIETVDLDANTLYDALSYTWGDPRPSVSQRPDWEATEHSIYLNGCLKPITTNLYQALIRLRSLKSGPLDGLVLQKRIWIDALCINQNDLAEKAVHVSKMTEVYKNASSVIAWLGEADEHTAPAVSILESMAKIPPSEYPDHQSRPLHQLGINDDSEEKWTSLLAFFCRAWFNRVWVIQEVMLATQLFVVCGQTLIGPDVMKPAADYMVKVNMWAKLAWHARAFATPEQMDKEVPSATAVVGAFSDELRQHVTQGLLHPKILSMFGRACRATDPRDHFYGLYGMINEAIALSGEKSLTLPRVRYDQPVEEVFVQWARFMIEEQENYFLFSMLEDRAHRSLSGLPSWVPDLSVSQMPGAIQGHGQRGRWRPAGERSDGKIIFVENSNRIRTPAARFDFITAVGPEYADDSSEMWMAVLALIRPLVSMNDSYASPLRALARTMTSDAFPCETAQLVSVFVEFFLSMLLGGNSGAFRVLVGYAQLLACAKNRAEIPRLADVMTISRDAGRQRRIQAYDAHRKVVTNGRCLFLTSRNYMGVAARSIQEGDEVWIMPNSHAPVVLREAGDTSFIIMGETYVDGVMDGEASRWTDDQALDWTEIEIC